MTRVILLWLCGLVLVLSARGRESPGLRLAADEAAARRVHALLDEHQWAQLVRITNRMPTRVLPAVAWATVFALGDRLWIYLPREGTQSLSVFAGRLARDQADLSDILQRLHAGFVAHEVVAGDDSVLMGIEMLETMMAAGGELPNACFVRSVAWYQRLLALGAPVENAHLLLLYGGQGASRWGHTVLCFEADDGWFYWDPDSPAQARPVPGGEVDDDLATARRVSRGISRLRIDQARRFELPLVG